MKENMWEIRHNIKDSFKLAKSLCENYHYSKTVPPSKHYFLVYEESELVGCLTFGTGANPYMNTHLKVQNGEALELTRVCFSKHKNYISFYFKKCIQILKANGIKLVFSYSDLRQSHFGTLYRAMNFQCMGEKKLKGVEIWNETKNRWEHQRNYWKKYKARENQELNWDKWVEFMEFKTRPQSNKILWIYKLERGK